ncbi:transcriptional regulator, TetR family [Oscillospiraceae bacterium]|nr:transcriptional regulator, TetR family [Oscillospiraceae bacterium]
MGRKTKITREMILDAAYELLDESGIGAVAIKPIAAKLGCSTQPISWQFGSMTELKKELFFYAAGKMGAIMSSSMEGKEAVEAFFISGVVYISLACEHPHIFRFLCVDDPTESVGEEVLEGASIFNMQFDMEAVGLIAKEYKVPEEKLSPLVRDVVIYTHGLAAMMMYDSFRLPRETACMMMYELGERMLESVGIELPEERKKAVLENINRC